MKQKVVVKTIITQDEKILLLRRHGGRPSIDGLYELPGGRVHIQQQPEDALSHALKIHLGITLGTARLNDVMSFVDPDDREVQYVFIIFKATLNPGNNTIDLSPEYDKYVWKKMSDIQLNEITQSTQQILDLQPVPFAPGRYPDVVEEKDAKNTTHTRLVGYCDGGSRGNPGPAAAGFVLFNTTEMVVAEGGAYLGVATNTIAEYQALYLALEKALALGAANLDMYLDSTLVVNQMNGEHVPNDNELTSIYNRIEELLPRFQKITFSHVAREKNMLADGVVNRLLDEHTK